MSFPHEVVVGGGDIDDARTEHHPNAHAAFRLKCRQLERCFGLVGNRCAAARQAEQCKAQVAATVSHPNLSNELR